MATVAAELSPYLFRLAETIIKSFKEDDKNSYYELHKQTAGRILVCNPSKNLEILAVKEPIIQAAFLATFNILSSLLSAERNIGVQYELAQKAYSCQ